MRTFAPVVLLATLVTTPAAFAQDPPDAAAGAQAAEPRPFSLGVAWGHDSYHYRFENLSRYDTAESVRHAFEQDHAFDAPWLTGAARYRFAGRTWETRGRVSIPVTGVGSDYDTFFDPDGNTIVYGTTADTDAWSLEVGQTVELGMTSGLRWRVGYSYRRDRAEYHDSWSTTTTTRPPGQSQFWNTDRETTISQVHQVRVGVSRDAQVSGRWRLRVVADLAPATLAILTTELPDKYPEPVTFSARALSLDASLDAGYSGGRTSWHLVVDGSFAWHYSSSSAFTRRGVQAGIRVGF
jgi:hypothetical protein